MSKTHEPTLPGVTKQLMDGVSDAVEVALVPSHMLLRYLLLVVSGRFCRCARGLWTEKAAAFLAYGRQRRVPSSARVLAIVVRVGDIFWKGDRFCLLARMVE